MSKANRPSEGAKELRAAAKGIEVRADPGAASAVKIGGYAALYDVPSQIADFEEVITRGAFDQALASGADVVLLLDHGGLPLARTRSGTLRLFSDDTGLGFEAELDPEDPDAARALSKIKRGDLGEMSFGFIVRASVWEFDRDIPLRTISDVELIEISIVVFPAYADTSVALRSLEAARSSARPADTETMEMRLALAKRGL